MSSVGEQPIKACMCGEHKVDTRITLTAWVGIGGPMKGYVLVCENPRPCDAVLHAGSELGSACM